MKAAMDDKQTSELLDEHGDEDCKQTPSQTSTATVPEIGGVKGPEPTRFGDWEKNGRCVDF